MNKKLNVQPLNPQEINILTKYLHIQKLPEFILQFYKG